MTIHATRGRRLATRGSAGTTIDAVAGLAGPFVCEEPWMRGASHSMTNRFPTPWRIVEIPNGFAVDDATGQQPRVFHGRAHPTPAGHTRFLTTSTAAQDAH